MFQFQFVAAVLLSAAVFVTGATIATASTAGAPTDEVGILVATASGLDAVSLNTLSVTETSPNDTFGVTFDTKTGKALWWEYSSKTVRRGYPDGTELEILHTVTGYVYAVAIDAYTGNVYYGEALGDLGDRIMLCNRDVQNCVAIASAPVVSYPIGIAVHVHRSKIYWTNRGSVHNIVKANLDGSDATIIVTGLDNPGGIVVDNDNRRIYWTETGSNTIGTCDLEGGDKGLLVASLRDRRPFGLAMHMNLLYIGNYGSSNVLSVDKNTGGDLRVVYSSPSQITHVAIIESTARLTAYEDNPCEGNTCSHLCVPTRNSYRCLCPENMHLAGSPTTCLQSK